MSRRKMILKRGMFYILILCLRYGTILKSSAAAVCTTSSGNTCCDGYVKNGTKCQPCPGGTYGKSCSKKCTCKVLEECHHVSGTCSLKQPDHSVPVPFTKKKEIYIKGIKHTVTNITAGGMNKQTLPSDATKIVNFLNNTLMSLTMLLVYIMLSL